ncbi:NAD(P)-binding protein [Ramaria rubella]|nr:NAD(P)-binding protein [Ramaria rubella]
MSNPFELSNLFSAKGLVAVVTGGGSGLGLMVSAALEHNGATVYIIGRRKEALEKAAKEHAKYGKIIPIQGDVTSRESLLSAVSAIESQSGYINLLVNNSGVHGELIKYPPVPSTDIKDFQKMLWETTPEDFQQVFNVNVTAVYFTTVAFLELLDKGNKHGGIPGVSSQVITMSSISGFKRDGKPSGMAYTTSKAAVTHLGKILANLLKDFHIRSNVVAPGFYPSEMSAVLGTPGSIPRDVIPAQRWGDEQDMGGLFLFLATRAGAYTNGNVSVTDGGRIGVLPSTY